MPYKEIVICPVCGHRVQRKRDGTVGSHLITTKNQDETSSFKCSGINQPAGKVVAAYTVWP